jgi:hypothetical protein
VQDTVLQFLTLADGTLSGVSKSLSLRELRFVAGCQPRTLRRVLPSTGSTVGSIQI